VGVLREEPRVATFENVVMISRPIEDVFGFLSDFENIPKWNYAIVETHKVSEGPVGVGTIYRQVRSVPSRSEESFEVTAFDAPRYLEVRGQLGPFPSRLSYALDVLPEGPASRTRWSLTYAVLAACSGGSQCRVSETPWLPTLGS
jgi:Polyketide cyclase / dehydrase and lipid transport